MRLVPIRTLLLAILSLLLITPVWAGWDEGKAAHERGDFEAALEELKPVAEQGHAGA